jgi:hypothetical protein
VVVVMLALVVVVVLVLVARRSCDGGAWRRLAAHRPSHSQQSTSTWLRHRANRQYHYSI